MIGDQSGGLRTPEHGSGVLLARAITINVWVPCKRRFIIVYEHIAIVVNTVTTIENIRTDIRVRVVTVPASAGRRTGTVIVCITGDNLCAGQRYR
jgi:hypothetical protein